VHNGSQDMRELGRKGGRAIPKAKRDLPDGERQTLREHLREQAEPAKVWEAIQAGLASSNERDKLAAAKLLLNELYEPVVECQRENEAEAARARERFHSAIDAVAARRALSTLVEQGVIRPGPGRPFEGVVMFDLHELAEWVGAWTPRPVTVGDVSCGTCGKAAVRIVAEGETVDGGPVYCVTCRPEEEAEVSSPGPGAASSDLPPLDEPLRRRSLA
jgi:hypothetical protein